MTQPLYKEEAERITRVLGERVADAAAVEGLSVGDFIILAVTEKLSRLEHQRWLTEQQAARSTQSRPVTH